MDLSYPTEQVYGTSFITDATCNLFKIVLEFYYASRVYPTKSMI